MNDELKIISEKEMLKEIEKGKLKMAVFTESAQRKLNKKVLLTLDKYFNIAAEYNTYIVYKIKPEYDVG